MTKTYQAKEVKGVDIIIAYTPLSHDVLNAIVAKGVLLGRGGGAVVDDAGAKVGVFGLREVDV